MFWETGRPFTSSHASSCGQILCRTNWIRWQHVWYAHTSLTLTGPTVAHVRGEINLILAFHWCHSNSTKVLEVAKGSRLLQAVSKGYTKPLNTANSRELTYKMCIAQPLKIEIFWCLWLDLNWIYLKYPNLKRAGDEHHNRVIAMVCIVILRRMIIVMAPFR